MIAPRLGGVRESMSLGSRASAAHITTKIGRELRCGGGMTIKTLERIYAHHNPHQEGGPAIRRGASRRISAMCRPN